MSDIARLRAQIEAEHAACVQAMNGQMRGAARHDFINARFKRMDEYYQQLSTSIGEKEAINIIMELFKEGGDATSSYGR